MGSVKETSDHNYSPPEIPLFKRTPHTSPVYKDWRKSILKRDEGICRECFDKKGIKNRRKLEVHHIYPVSSNPELELEEDNGITLCRECHYKTRGKESDFVDYYKDLIGSPIHGLRKNSYKTLRDSYNLVRRLYLETDATNKEIADYIGCCSDRITYIVGQLGLPNRWEISKLNKEAYYKNPNRCICGKPLEYKKRDNKYCSNRCQFDDPNRIITKPKSFRNSGQFQKGREVPEQDRLKISLAHKGKKKAEGVCPVCGKTGSINHLKRWHFSNCKNRGDL